MEIHLIWAQDSNGGIGKDGNLPWHISEDLKNFKNLTIESPIIMGRKTWESLPIKPLPKRRNIVLSHSNQNEVASNNEENTNNIQSEGNVIAQPEPGIKLDSTHAYEDDSVLQSDLKTIKQSAVKMSVGQKQGASQIVKDWLDDSSESDQDNEANDQNDKSEE